MGSTPIQFKRLTRRQVSALLGVAPLAAQTAPSHAAASPKAAAPATTSEEQLAKAVDDVRKTRARLAQLEVPMNVEPAFVFKV